MDQDHEKAIFNTTYWFITPQEGNNVRFTPTVDAFYILLLTKPGKSLFLESLIPWVEGDKVRVVGGTMNGAIVPTREAKDGQSVEFTVSDDIRTGDQSSWVFEISY